MNGVAQGREPSHSRRFFVALCFGLLVSTLLVGGTRASAHHNFWAQCNTNTAYNLSSWTRAQARSYATVARFEGYHWGGGCWNNNNIDDQPGDPIRTVSTHGEGGDCSGFVFKSWGLKHSETATGFHYWPRMHNVHGPFHSTEFRDGLGPSLYNVTKSATVPMDAMAKAGHVGMIYTLTSNENTDMIIEARGEYHGTGIWQQLYRGDPEYKGVRRAGGCLWDGTCG